MANSNAGLDFEQEAPASGDGLDFQPEIQGGKLDFQPEVTADEQIGAALTQKFGADKVERFRARGYGGGSILDNDPRPALTEEEMGDFHRYQRAELQLVRDTAPNSQLAEGLNWLESLSDASRKAMVEQMGQEMARLSITAPFAGSPEDWAQRVKDTGIMMSAPMQIALGAAPNTAGIAAGSWTAKKLAATALGRIPYIGPLITIGSAVATGVAATEAVRAAENKVVPRAANSPLAQVGDVASLVIPSAQGVYNLAKAGAIIQKTAGTAEAAKVISSRLAASGAAGVGIDWAMHEGLKGMGVDDGDYDASRALRAAVLSVGLNHYDFKARGLSGRKVADIVENVNREVASGAKPGTAIDTQTGKPVNSAADVEVWRSVGEHLAAMKAKGDTFVQDPKQFQLKVWQLLSGDKPMGRANVVTGPIEPNAPKFTGLDFEPEVQAPAPATPAAPAGNASEARFMANAGDESTVAPAAREAGIVPGAQTTVFGTRGTELPAVYAWAPSSAVQTSHSGQMMAANPNYKLSNTRDYSSPEERDKQLAVLANFDARRHVTDAPDAAVGPSLVATIIDENGDASLQRLGGNNRGYAIQNLPADKRAALRALENEKAGQFGLQPTNDKDAELVRYLGTFDFRQPGEKARAQSIVDVLNPAPGMVQGAGKRAELDAASVPADQLTTTPDGGRYTMDLAPKVAQELVSGLIANGHVDRNLTAAIAANPTSAQDYAHRLLLNSAYRQTGIAEARMDARSAGTAVRGMIDAAVPALVQIRAQGGGDVADAIARAYTTTLGYLDSKGSNLPAALDKAAAQTELTPGHDVTQSIAEALRQAVVMDKGRIDTERTIDNARGLFDRMAGALQQRDPAQQMLFGGTESVGDVVRRALGIDSAENDFRLREDERQLHFPYAEGKPQTPKQAARALRPGRGGAVAHGDASGRGAGPVSSAEAEIRRASILAALSKGQKVDPATLHQALVEGRPISSVLHDAVAWNLGFDVVGATVQNAQDFAALNLALRNPHRESLRIAAIVNGKVVASAVLHIGSLNESIASPATAVAWLAANKVPKGAQIAIAHNHPSGNPAPSGADVQVTDRYQEAVEMAGYKWGDHVITNGHEYYTFRGQKLEKFPVRVRAPWELVPREQLGEINDSEAWRKLAGTLRTGDPDAIHAVYLSTKCTLVAIERLPVSDPNTLMEQVINGSSREGARFVAVSFPKGTWADNDGALFQFSAAVKRAAPQISIADAARPGMPSAKARSVFETPAHVAEDPELLKIREEDDLRAEMHAEPNYSPLRAVDERGNPYAPVVLAGLKNIKIVEMPELVQLVRELTGLLPEIRRLRKARGLMYPIGKGLIRLDARIFADPISAAKTLAHELGHVVDYLPNQALKRGNLWGRIHALRNYLKERWTPSGPKAKELRAELIALSKMWKPYDPATDPESYVKYRESGVELYADFISVLFNSPAIAKQIAPNFWREFWQAVPHAKQVVHDAIMGVQQWLTQPMATRLQQRSQKVDDMFAAGEEAFERKFEERQQRYHGFRGLMSRLKQAWFDQYAPIRDRAAAVGNWDVEALFDGHPLAQNEHWTWLDRLRRQVTEPLEAADWTLDDLGRYLFYDRIVNENYPLSEAMAEKMGHATGGRSVIANPLGHTPNTARLGLLQMRLEAGGNTADPTVRARGRSRIAALERAVQLFHDHVLDVMREAHNAELLTAGQWNLIQFNSQHYAAFVPLEYVDTFVPSGVYHQAGTFKEISSPFLSTVLKVLTMQRAIQLQKLKTATVGLLKGSFGGEIAAAVTRKSADGRTERPVPPRERSQGQIMLREAGRPTWYNVPREIALMFDYTPAPLLESTLDILRVPFQKFFYPLFITYNPVFQLATNPIRDARRTNINRPNGVGFWSVVRQLPILKQFGPNPALDAARALVDRVKVEPIIAEMLDNLAIGPGDATFAVTAGVVDSAFDRILQQHGHLPAEEQSNWMPKNWPIIGGVLRAIERAGKINELLPKISVYRQLRILGWDPKEAALFVRSYIGTPNFGRRGKHVSIANTVFPFFNIWTKGWAADAELARRGFKRRPGPNSKKGSSAAAWWMRWAAFSAVPVVIGVAAKLGLLGKDVKHLMDGIGLYDRKNYDVIPLGYAGASDVNPDGKVAYLRVPKDPTDRVLSGIFSNILESVATKAAKAGAFGGDVAQMNKGAEDSIATALMRSFSIGANDVPGVNPLVKILKGWTQYASGQNPYDDFYGRNILSDTQQDARGLPAFTQMLIWTGQQSGAQHFVRLNGNDSTTEIIVGNTPAVSGLVKISDSGYLQIQADAKLQQAQRRAEEKLALNSTVQSLATEFHHLQDLGTTVRTPAQELRYQNLRGWNRSVYEPGLEAIEAISDDASKKRLRQNIERQSETYKRQ